MISADKEYHNSDAIKDCKRVQQVAVWTSGKSGTISKPVVYRWVRDW
jgi:hypothetical protein